MILFFYPIFKLESQFETANHRSASSGTPPGSPHRKSFHAFALPRQTTIPAEERQGFGSGESFVGANRCAARACFYARVVGRSPSAPSVSRSFGAPPKLLQAVHSQRTSPIHTLPFDLQHKPPLFRRVERGVVVVAHNNARGKWVARREKLSRRQMWEGQEGAERSRGEMRAVRYWPRGFAAPRAVAADLFGHESNSLTRCVSSAKVAPLWSTSCAAR